MEIPRFLEEFDDVESMFPNCISSIRTPFFVCFRPFMSVVMLYIDTCLFVSVTNCRTLSTLNDVSASRDMSHSSWTIIGYATTTNAPAGVTGNEVEVLVDTPVDTGVAKARSDVREVNEARGVTGVDSSLD